MQLLVRPFDRNVQHGDLSVRRRCEPASGLQACKWALAGVAAHMYHEITLVCRSVLAIRLLASEGPLAGVDAHVRIEVTFVSC